MKARMLVIAGLLLLLAAPAAFASPWAVNFIAGPNGSISGDVNQTVPDFGSTTAVTAVPNSGYHFVNWTGTGGFVTTTANPLIVSGVTTSMDITANFNVGPATMTLPDYSMPLLTPASQEATAWTNVIPNALAAYYTYVPYSNLDAENLGFPPTCGNPNLPGAMQNDLDSTEDCYTITVKKFQQQLAIPDIFGGGSGLLNPATGLPFGAVTQVYGYGSGGVGWTPPAGLDIVTGNAPAPFVDGTYGTTGIWHFPAPTIRGKNGRPIRIQWLNELPNEAPVGFDPTVDCGPNAPDCYPYNRIVTHVHGAHVPDDSDGYAAAWFTPNFALTGPGWLASTYGPQGTYRYPMDQEAATIWYHDHAMGTTHTNTQMGLAGFFPITDANEQALIAANILPTGAYELGFALQDRMFDTNGQFAMPDYPVYDLFSMTTNTITGCTLTVDGLADPATCTRLDWMKDPADGHLVPYVQGHPFLTHPSGINAGAPFPAAGTTLEYFGNMPVVNGVTYGKYDVEPRVYRMRFIGGTDSRTWVMQLVTRGTGTVIPFWQIGSEQGFLNNPVPRDTMDLMPGERLDVLVDLTGIPPGTKIVMQNIGPDSPYGGPATLLDPAYVPSVDIPEILEFNVIGLSGPDAIMTPSFGTNLRPVSGAIAPLVPTPGTPVRKIALEEIVDQYGRTMPTIDQRGFMQMGVPATEVVRLNDTEEWDLINTTVDAHPMHLHLVQFQVVSRQTFTSFVSAVTDTVTGSFGQPSYTSTGFATTATSNLQGVEPWEAGWKDTVDCPPGLVTTIKAKFDIAGDKYVYHCHILSHEEHDMMRPLVVAAPLTVNFIAGTGGSVVGTLNQSVPYLASATTVTAVPNAGYHFVNWTGNGGFVTTGSNPLTVTNVTAAMDITANFEIDTYAVNFSAGPNGSISGTANQTVAYLASASTVTALPNAGYHFVNWTGTGGFVTIGSNPLTVEYVTAAMDITANFALGSPTVSLPAEYSMALLTPDSQVATAWTNVIPNALASYYTYVPYSSADAVALGFPSSCGNPEKGTPADLASTEDCYTITVKSFVQQLAIPGIFGGGSGLLDQNGIAFGAATRAYGYGSGGVNWTPPNASVSVTGNAPAPFVDGTFGTTGIWHFPAPTIRGTKGRPIRIQWLNELPNEMPSGFDPTVDCGPNAPDCFPYNRIVTHVHGAHVPDDSDGYAPAGSRRTSLSRVRAGRRAPMVRKVLTGTPWTRKQPRSGTTTMPWA
jgi:spore coat protein A